MDRLRPADLASLAESVAREAAISGALKIAVESDDKAPFGDFSHSDIRLSSSEPGSCPITLSLFEDGDADGWVTISFGASYHEAWFLPPKETLDVVEEFLRAVMRGDYEEWQRPDRDEDHDVYGHLTDGHGPGPLQRPWPHIDRRVGSSRLRQASLPR